MVPAIDGRGGAPWTQAEFEVPAAASNPCPPSGRVELESLSSSHARSAAAAATLHVRAGATLTLKPAAAAAAAGPPRPAAPPPSLPPQPAAPGGPSAHPRERSCGARWSSGGRLSRGARHARAVGGGEGGRVDRGHQPRPADIGALRGVVDVMADVDPSGARRGEGARPRQQQRIGVEHRQGWRPTGDRLARRAHGDHLPQHGPRHAKCCWTGVAADGRARPHVPIRPRRTSFVAEGSDGYNGISLSEQLGRPRNELGGGTNFRRPCNLLVHSRDLCHEMYRRFCGMRAQVLLRPMIPTATRTANGRGAPMSRRAMGATATRTRGRATRCAKA